MAETAPVHIAVLTLSLHLEGCQSLKEKRGRVLGIRDRFGKMPQVAVCESDHADRHDKSEWSFVCVASQRATAAGILDTIEQRIASETDAVIYRRQCEWL